MTKKTFALIVIGGAAIAGTSIGLAACSSDSGNNVTPPGPDGSQPDTSQNNNDSSMPDSGMQPDTSPACTHGAAPNLHPSDGGPMSLFCGYAGDAGTKVECDPKTQVCCIGGKQGTGFADEQCNTIGTACTNGMGPHELDCEAVGDCSQGKLCCYTGPTPTIDEPACGYYYAKSTISTKCATSCASGDIALCSSDAECGDAGKKCTPFKTIFFGLGFCN